MIALRSSGHSLPHPLLKAHGRRGHTQLLAVATLGVLLTSVAAAQPGVQQTGPKSAAAPTVPPYVVTAQGAMFGSVLPNGTHQYLGIPYAAPMTADGRWRAPEDPLSWSGTVERTEFGPPCPQIGNSGQLLGQEDCLTLNVWAPADAQGLPVIVYLHGGSHWHAHSGIEEWGVPAYGGETLAERGVVVVTLNYRTGILGFLAHSDLGPEGPGGAHYNGGNYGVMDQMAALRWVQQNIAAFGGDPARVTGWGQSGGAVDLCVIVASPEGAGLLSGAFFQSGSCQNLLPMTTPEEEANEIASILGHTPGPGAIAALRGEPLESLFAAMQTAGSATNSPRRWMPVVDDFVIRDLAPAVDPDQPPDYPLASFDDPRNDTPLKAIEAGLHNAMPLMVSTTIEEPINYPPPQSPIQTIETLEQILAAMGFFNAIRFAHELDPDPLFNPPPIDAEIFSWIKTGYSLHDVPPGPHWPPNLYEGQLTQAFYDLYSDAVFLTRSRTEARAYALGNGDQPVWRAIFAHDQSAAPLGAFGAGHSVDNFYYFNRMGLLLQSQSPPIPYPPSPDDVHLAEWMQDQLIQFAATGDPNLNPSGAGGWLPYADDGGTTDLHMRIGEWVGFELEGLPGDGVRTVWCDFWEWTLTPVLP